MKTLGLFFVCVTMACATEDRVSMNEKNPEMAKYMAGYSLRLSVDPVDRFQTVPLALEFVPPIGMKSPAPWRKSIFLYPLNHLFENVEVESTDGRIVPLGVKHELPEGMTCRLEAIESVQLKTDKPVRLTFSLSVDDLKKFGPSPKIRVKKEFLASLAKTLEQNDQPPPPVWNGQLQSNWLIIPLKEHE